MTTVIMELCSNGGNGWHATCSLQGFVNAVMEHRDVTLPTKHLVRQRLSSRSVGLFVLLDLICFINLQFFRFKIIPITTFDAQGEDVNLLQLCSSNASCSRHCPQAGLQRSNNQQWTANDSCCTRTAWLLPYVLQGYQSAPLWDARTIGQVCCALLFSTQ